jgi:hypothetical protein
MAYYIDDTKVTLEELKNRIIETDLVPSRRLFLEHIDDNFAVFTKLGIVNLGNLRKALKSAAAIIDYSQKTGIDSEYLTILKREIESYFQSRLR